ncbi:MAG: hypothetical protein IKH04_01475, partial [Kiritimatiellae bacterium]|nr:hypothetical protein [Kiritimatiellia bacterium]
LHLRQDPDAVFLATRPLDVSSVWEPLPLCTPLAFRDGEAAFSAPSHGHEYIPNPDDFRLFFTDYANL